MVVEPPVILDRPPPPGGHRGPKPPPIPIGRDPPPSDPPRRWYQRLEIMLPALIALGVVMRVLLDVYADVLQLNRQLSQRTFLVLFASIPAFLLLYSLVVVL